MTTDTSERGLERLICGEATGYDREHYPDLAQLLAFLRTIQPEVCEAVDLDEAEAGSNAQEAGAGTEPEETEA